MAKAATGTATAAPLIPPRPSAVLRIPDSAGRARARREMVADLAAAAKYLSRIGQPDTTAGTAAGPSSAAPTCIARPSRTTKAFRLTSKVWMARGMVQLLWGTMSMMATHIIAERI